MKRVLMVLLVAVSLATVFAAGALAGPGESGGIRPQSSITCLLCQAFSLLAKT